MAFSCYQARRQALCDKMVDNSLAVLAAAPMYHRNHDTEYPYRQDSYFYYLTGLDESDAVAVMIKNGGKSRFIIFCQEKDKKVEQWTGPRLGIQGALDQLGADEAYPITAFDEHITKLFMGMGTLYYLIHAQPEFERRLLEVITSLRQQSRSGVECPYQFFDLRVLLGEMRVIKRPEEIEALEKACEISSGAHIKAMQSCRPGMMEYELEAVLLQEFYRHGSRYPAYPSIVAGGERACILHYTKNNAPIKDNSLVLIDAGAEYDYYAADITRTFPANGRFTAEQQAIYELVLAAQISSIEMIRPGILWNEIQNNIIKIFVTGLKDLKILKGDVASLIEQKAYLPFYMHNSGHWLGMDVHDVGDYKVNHDWRPLTPGMVFTVEPGLYLSELGIGVRIEDDILVTETGYRVLTEKVPKTVSELQKNCKSKVIY